MSLLGRGVIAIWQDLAPGTTQEFREWHNRQHVPERVGIPGFRRGRRFVAVEGAPEFYTLYEAESVDDLAGKHYLERLNSPTEWTQRIMPLFQNMARSVCRVLHSESLGEGGYMVTLRFHPPSGQREALAEASGRIAQPLAARRGIVGVHICVADEQASTVKTLEKTFRANDLTPQAVAMVEASTLDQARETGRLLSAALVPFSDSAAEMAIYRAEHTLTKTA